MLNYDVGIIQSLDQIFGGVLIGAIEKTNPNAQKIIAATKINRARFRDCFPTNIFQDEYAIFYDIMINLNAKVFDINQLESIIDTNRDLVLDSPHVNIEKYSSTQSGTQATEDEKIEAIKINLKEQFILLSNMYVSEDEFNSSCSIFIDWFQKQYMLQTAQSMARIMSNQGYEERKPGKRTKKYSGFADCKAFYNENIKILSELDTTDRVRSVVVNEDWLEDELQDEGKVDEEALMPIGLTEIDSTMGELRRGNMLGILGPPKGGKTRFTNFVVSQALHRGLNVCIWSLEGTTDEWIATQLAAMIKREHNISFNSKDILQKKYINNTNEKEAVQRAKIKMATDEKIGRLSFIESAAYVETFLDVLETHYENENPFDVLVIDQLIDILSLNGKTKTERISQAYQELKIFISKRMKKPVLAIIPAQLKQDVVDFLRKNPGETIDVTAGGESAETIRTPDEVIGLFSSKEERAANTMHIYSVASRHSGNFQDFLVKTDLRCCHFESDPNLN